MSRAIYASDLTDCEWEMIDPFVTDRQNEASQDRFK